MGILSEVPEIPRKTMIMFFLVDTSGSMEGANIAAVNEAMREIIPVLQDVSKSNADALIKIAILEFAAGTDWITPFPQELDTFKWQNLTAGGYTELGAACRELNKKLDRNEFLQDKVGNYAPVIILLSDGAPSDDFKGGLTELQKNKWFNSALKVAMAVDDADKDCLAEFTENIELVIPVNGSKMLKKMIKFISVTSSKIGSKVIDSNGAQSKEVELIEAINFEMENIDPEENIDEGW